MSVHKAQAEKRIAVLREEIRRHEHLYYQVGQPEISDRDFDGLMAELQRWEEAHPELASEDSPTQRVGGEPLAGFDPVTHDPPMLSLENTYNAEELDEWEERMRRLVPEEPFSFVAELKVDGVSISLLYEEGVLRQAATRGNGRVGDDVTRNLRTVRTIPLRLAGDPPPRLIVRGEVYMPLSVFRDLNAEREAAGEPLYVNPRNTTAGSVRLLDSRQVATRRLAVVVYDAVGSASDRHSEILKDLEGYGLPVNPGWRPCADLAEVKGFVDEWQDKRHTLDFETDGVVVKIDALSLRARLGATSKAPRWAVAYKYAAERATTRVCSIGVQVGRTGALTPVAELEPVFIAGSTVRRATLHNYEDLERKDVRVGDTVFVEKGGDVIPKVVGVRLEDRPPDSRPFEIPTHCPICREEVIRLPGEVAWRCVNAACPAIVKESIHHFVSRNAMDVEGLGDRLIDQLLEAGFLTDYTSLYSLRPQDLAKLPGWGRKSAENLSHQLEKSKDRGLAAVLFALGIRFVGERGARLLARHFVTLDAVAAATEEELMGVPEVGPKVAASVRSFFSAPHNLERLARLRSAGVSLVEKTQVPEEAVTASKHPLAGKVFVLTGALERLSRREAQERLEAVGARVSSSVSSKTDFVVAGDKAGAKLEKARSLGVEVLDEEGLLSRLPNGSK